MKREYVYFKEKAFGLHETHFYTLKKLNGFLFLKNVYPLSYNNLSTFFHSSEGQEFEKIWVVINCSFCSQDIA